MEVLVVEPSDPENLGDPQNLDATGSISILYQQWRGGRPDALNELIARFWPRLMALASSTLAGRLQRVADAEDALQSAMISFWEQVDRGGFKEDMDRDDLWNVMGLITVRKAIKLQEKEHAQKRGGGRVVTGVSLENSSGAVSEAEFDLLCTELLEMLEPELRSFALLRLMGHKNREIAEELDCTERKVERKLQLVRVIWGEEAANWNC
jgi:RNA polymerase sigma factor (sigma-70 family)